MYVLAVIYQRCPDLCLLNIILKPHSRGLHQARYPTVSKAFILVKKRCTILTIYENSRAYVYFNIYFRLMNIYLCYAFIFWLERVTMKNHRRIRKFFRDEEFFFEKCRKNHTERNVYDILHKFNRSEIEARFKLRLNYFFDSCALNSYQGSSVSNFSKL